MVLMDWYFEADSLEIYWLEMRLKFLREKEAIDTFIQGPKSDFVREYDSVDTREKIIIILREIEAIPAAN